MSKRWSRKEIQALMDGVGSYGIRTLRRRTESLYGWPNADKRRSTKSLYAAARRHFGRGGLTRGAYTLRRLTSYTGYSRTQVLRARDALGQKWKRLRAGGSFLVTEDQLLEIVEWLAHDYWDKDRRLYCCLGCQSEKRRPFGLGFCVRCYSQYRRMCKKIGVPTKQSDQRKLIEGVSRIPIEIDRRLNRRLGLSSDHLRWLSVEGKKSGIR